MMGPSERNPGIVEEFLRRRKRQMIIIAPTIFAVVMLVGADQGGIPGVQPRVLIGLSIALIVGCVGFSLTNWRCPSCQRYLGKALNPKFCLHCGVPLQ